MKQKTHPKDFIPKKEPLYTGYAANIDYDIMLERAVLGICLSEPRSYSQIYGVLNSECFYLDAHKVIFEAMHRVWEHGEPVDLFTVSRRLYDEGVLFVSGEFGNPPVWNGEVDGCVHCRRHSGCSRGLVIQFRIVKPEVGSFL